MAKKKQKNTSPLSRKEADALLGKVESIGNEGPDRTRELSARPTTFTPGEEDIPMLTDRVAQTRLNADAARKSEVRSKVKLDTHLETMRKLRTGESTPAWQVPNIPTTSAIKARASVGAFLDSKRPNNEALAATQPVVDAYINARKIQAGPGFTQQDQIAKTKVTLDKASLKETKAKLKSLAETHRVNIAALRAKKAPKEEIDAVRAKYSTVQAMRKNPEAHAKQWSPQDIEDARTAHAMNQGLRPSSSIESNLRSNLTVASGRRNAAITAHLFAKTDLEAATGEAARIREMRETANRAAEPRESDGTPRDAATGAEYGSANTITRGKSATDPAVETVAGDARKTRKQVSFGDADFADLARAVSPIRSLVAQGGGNVRFPQAVAIRGRSDGSTREVKPSEKSPVSGGAIDSLLLSAQTSHSNAIASGPYVDTALAHVRDAHETLLTLKSLVPRGTEVHVVGSGAYDFHKHLDIAIRQHSNTYAKLVDRVKKTGAAVRRDLPTLADTKTALYKKPQPGTGKPIVETGKGGRRTYNLEKTTGEAVTGGRGRRLAGIAGLTRDEGRPGDTVPADARVDIMNYREQKAPPLSERVTSPEEQVLQDSLEAYAIRKGQKSGRLKDFNASTAGGGMGPSWSGGSTS